jgi:bifunctional non-homologous end joining protein LigD
MLASGICERTRVTSYHQGLLLDYVDAKADGPTVFRHACKLGLEGIVSKRLGSRNQSGRLPHWLKMKNSNAPGGRREVPSR